MQNLIVEIGNTALKAAWTEGITLGKTFRYQGERPIDFIISLTEKEKPEVLTLATVNLVSPSDEKELSRHCGKLLILDEAHKQALSEYNLPQYLTYDRVAGMVAARYLFKGRPCTIMDFGTTFNVDFLDKDGNYEGGNIAPGCRTRFKALNRYSKSLPLVNMPQGAVTRGTSIKTAIEAGVVEGIMFEIFGYISQNPENMVIFTGGDAIYFEKLMKISIFAVCNLVLMGLALITEEYVEKSVQ